MAHQPGDFVILEVPHVIFWLINGERWADYADVDGVRVWASAENKQQFEGYTATWVPADGNVHVYLVPDEGFSFHTTHLGGRRLYAGDVEVRHVQNEPTNPEPVHPIGPAIDEAAFTITIPDDDFNYFVGDTPLPVEPYALRPIGAGAVTATVQEGVTAHPDAVLEWPFSFATPAEPVYPTPEVSIPAPSPETTAPPAAISTPKPRCPRARLLWATNSPQTRRASLPGKPSRSGCTPCPFAEPLAASIPTALSNTP